MKRLALLLIPLLAACQHNQQGVRVVYQDRPVPVACVPLEEIPAEPPTVSQTFSGDWNHDGPILAASALMLRSWGRDMHGLLTACAATSTNEPPNVSSEQSGG